MTSAAQLLSEQDHRDTWSLTIGKDMSDEDIEFVREAGAEASRAEPSVTAPRYARWSSASRFSTRT